MIYLLCSTVLVKMGNFCSIFQGTMLQSKKDILTDKKCFELISCATNSSHVKNYLARYLRFDIYFLNLKIAVVYSKSLFFNYWAQKHFQSVLKLNENFITQH